MDLLPIRKIQHEPCEVVWKMERCAQVQTFREKLLALEEGWEGDRLLHEVEWACLLTLSGDGKHDGKHEGLIRII